MKDRPIIFNGAMVRAIFEGLKTQTRRVVKPQPPEDSPPHEVAMHDPLRVNRSTGEEYPGPRQFGAYGDGWDIKCPFGQPGDRLWVRETWRIDGIGSSEAISMGDCDTARENLSFRADMIADRGCADCRWIPSIHMPRWVSRLTLEVISVRVERLQDISDDDAELEGITCERGIVGCHCNGGVHTEVMGDLYSSNMGGDGFEFASAAYRQLWESINGPGSWAANPWVWVVEFKLVKP